MLSGSFSPHIALQMENMAPSAVVMLGTAGDEQSSTSSGVMPAGVDDHGPPFYSVSYTVHNFIWCFFSIHLV